MNIRFLNESEARLCAYLDEHQDELFETLSALIKVDTRNLRTHGNENAGQDLLEKLCASLALDVDRFTPDSVAGVISLPDYMPGRSADTRENLVASYFVPDAEKTVMLAAHMDTESFGDFSLWEDDPLSGTIRDGKIYGRGAGDDKSGLAVAYYLIKAFKATGISPKKNILIGSYVDEEGGGGNGALALAIKHPVDCILNLDASGFEGEALGGGCFTINLRTTKNDKAIASIFDVFTGLNLIKEKLERLHGTGKNSIRLSSVTAGTNGEKEGTLAFAIYTDMSKEETKAVLGRICEELSSDFDKLFLTTEGFILRTRFFLYGESDHESKEFKTLARLIEEETKVVPNTAGTCLSDLSLLLRYGTKNSINYGIPRGSKEGGGAHQPNEHIYCDTLLSFAKKVALLLMRA